MSFSWASVEKFGESKRRTLIVGIVIFVREKKASPPLRSLSTMSWVGFLSLWIEAGEMREFDGASFYPQIHTVQSRDFIWIFHIYGRDRRKRHARTFYEQSFALAFGKALTHVEA